LVLSKGIELYGESKEKTIIKGKGSFPTVKMKNDNLLKNLTVQEGSAAIEIEGRADISNCIIKNSSGNGINMLANSGELKIKNSKITGNRKGFYIQKGSKASISENEVSGNKEEGIDIREKTSGSIIGNYIGGNGEGGIEVVIGSSNFFIKNNQIKKNKASGIASQFYSQAEKTGKIEIKSNTISGNGAYGLVCKAPSGGDIPRGYYNESLKLNENKIENNKKKSISGSCKIIEAVSDEEEKTNQTVESAAAQAEPEVQKTEEEKMEDESAAILLEKERHLDNLKEALSFEHNNIVSKFNQASSSLEKRSKIKIFFFGNNLEEIKKARMSIQEMKEEKASLEGAIRQLGDEEISNSKNEALSLISKIDDEISAAEKYILEQEKKFSLFGWVFKIFQNKEIVNYSS
jgi:parallel beta-helix repeat protein